MSVMWSVLCISDRITSTMFRFCTSPRRTVIWIALLIVSPRSSIVRSQYTGNHRVCRTSCAGVSDPGEYQVCLNWLQQRRRIFMTPPTVIGGRQYVFGSSVSSSVHTYRVGQLKWGQLTLLMVTFECIGKLQQFFGTCKLHTIRSGVMQILSKFCHKKTLNTQFFCTRKGRNAFMTILSSRGILPITMHKCVVIQQCYFYFF